MLISLLMVFMGGFFFVAYRTDNSVGRATKSQEITIEKGDDVRIIAKKLKEKELIAREIYFIYYAWTRDFSQKLVAGEYEIDPKLKIPEIIRLFVEGETTPTHVKVTFPEGWTAKEMSERLNEKGLSGDEFLKIVMNPPAEMVAKFDFLKNNPPESSLEGYLFPDTYFFAPEETADSIISRMLKNFDVRFSQDLQNQIEKQGKNTFEIITMASIVESEVRTDRDRKIVSGIFWNRIGIGMALQSDATVSYVLAGEKKIQHNAEDINIDSPYNTYRFKGLPPGPVSNPGVSSIEAAINPTETDYLYFLNNPKTGETFFSTTFDEHVRNKSANGL